MAAISSTYTLCKDRKASFKLFDYEQQLEFDESGAERKKDYQGRKRRRQFDSTSLSAAAKHSRKGSHQSSSNNTQSSLGSIDAQPDSELSAAAPRCKEDACTATAAEADSSSTNKTAPAALDATGSGALSKPSSVPSAAVVGASHSCSNCGSSKSAGGTWRQGPAGDKTLCNACGIRYSRQGAAALKAQLTAAAQQQIIPAISTGSSSSTAGMASSSQPAAAAPPESCEVTGISRSSSCLSAVTGGSKPRSKAHKQTTTLQQPAQQAQELRRSSRQQQKRNRQEADLQTNTGRINHTAVTATHTIAPTGNQCKRHRVHKVNAESKAQTRSKARSAAAVAAVVVVDPTDPDLLEAADVLLQLANGFWMETLHKMSMLWTWLANWAPRGAAIADDPCW